MLSDLQNNFTAIAIAFSVGIGLSVTLVAGLLARGLAAVPEEDRSYKDAPPLGFRLIWWPLQWISYYVDPLIPPKHRAALLTKLRQAGLDYSIKPAQLLAARIASAALVALVAVWTVDSFVTKNMPLQTLACGALFGWAYPAIWLGDRLAARKKVLLKTLPFYLDIITLCVEAGLNLQGALNQAVAKGPSGVLRDEFQRVLRDIRAGKPRMLALRSMSDRLQESSVSHFITSVIQAENMGMNLGPMLRAQADQKRTERFLRAEKLAMEAPVKLLFPLIAFIFPCTFIVLFFPIAMQFMDSGF